MNKSKEKVKTIIIILITIVGGWYLWQHAVSIGETASSHVPVVPTVPAVPAGEYTVSAGDGMVIVSKDGVEEFAVYPFPSFVQIDEEYGLTQAELYKIKNRNLTVYTRTAEGQTVYYVVGPQIDFVVFSTGTETSDRSIVAFLNEELDILNLPEDRVNK